MSCHTFRRLAASRCLGFSRRFFFATTGLCLLVQQIVSAATVTECSEASLRAALAGGGVVNLECDGVIQVTNTIRLETSAIMEAGEHEVTIRGNGLVRLFEIPSGIALTVTHLTLQNGQSTNGGAVWNGGTFTAVRCRFQTNNAVGQPDHFPTAATAGLGGAIFNEGTARLDDCQFSSNSATGGNASSVTASFLGLPGQGGAVANRGVLEIRRCLFVGNQATGGQPGYYGIPGYGGSAYGGALFNLGTVQIEASAFAGNRARAMHGFIHTGSSPSGPNGQSWGGAIHNAGGVALTNVTLTGNSVSLIPFDYTFPFHSGGGAISHGSGRAQLEFLTIATNWSEGDANDGLSGGIFCATDAVMEIHGVIFSRNRNIRPFYLANTNANVMGPITDLGHNLCDDGTCQFQAATSRNNIEPKLGPFGNHGGPTPSLPPLSGSPAIDAGDDAACPATDQRGVQRPAGAHCDIGAVEAYVLELRPTTGATWEARSSAPPRQACTLLASSDLREWIPWQHGVADDAGFVIFSVPASGVSNQFLRLALP